MTDERVNRKLAAILAADVVGYSRLMGADEAGTLAALKHHRQSIFDPAVAAHNGRIVKLIGDGTIVEFGSVVDAVNCALVGTAFRRALPDEALHQPKIVLRIGINLGDVIIEGDDIYGDGVNIAARLEPLAEPGGVCVSSIVNESVGNRIDVRFQDGGEIQRQEYRSPDPSMEMASEQYGAGRRQAQRQKPQPNAPTASIAVLPFTNMSGDPEQEYFSDGITEDIITDLSKIAGLTVIARNSSFTYKGRAVDIREVGSELGVRSVLEGSIRRAGNRVRITAQLIDADQRRPSVGRPLRPRPDRIFAVQDDVTRQIVEALKVTLGPAEKERPSDGGNAECRRLRLFVLRGRELCSATTRTSKRSKRQPSTSQGARASIQTIAVAYAGLGFGYIFDYQNRWTDDPDSSLPRAKQYARRRSKSGPNEPLSHCVTALCASFGKDLDRAKAEIDVAISLNPNLALAHNRVATFVPIRDSRLRGFR